MSIKAMNWAWEQKLEPTSKLVLLALADIADDTGRCWPSVSTLARKVHASERNTRRILLKLRTKSDEQRQLIQVDQRRRDNGSQRSNVYVLLMQTDNLSGRSESHGQTDTDVREGMTEQCQGEDVAHGTPGADTAVTPLEPPAVPPPDPKRRNTSQKAGDKQLSAEEQRALVRELSRVKPDTQSQLMAQLADGLRVGAIRSPSGWMKAAVDRITKTRSA